MTPAEKRLANKLRAGLLYAGKAAKRKILAMIAEIEAEQNSRPRIRAIEGALETHGTQATGSAGSPTNTKRAAVADPERKPREAHGEAVDRAGGSSETKARQTPLRPGERRPRSLRNTGIPGRAGEARVEALALNPPPPWTPTPGPATRPCALDGCAGRIPLTAREKYCSASCASAAQRLSYLAWQQRARARAVEDPEAPEEQRQKPLARPRCELTWDPTIIIRPDRPAPWKRDAAGVRLAFRDDYFALADHGSPGRIS